MTAESENGPGSTPRRRWWRRGADRTRERWEELAARWDGEVELAGGKPLRARLPHRSWALVLDHHHVSTGQARQTFTRVRALFVRVGPFELSVRRRRWYHAIGERVGLGGVRLGHAPVDRALFVRSDRGDLARALLRGTALGQALAAQRDVHLTVGKPARKLGRALGEGGGELQALLSGGDHEAARLDALVSLVATTLDEMERLHLASAEPVEGVSL